MEVAATLWCCAPWRDLRQGIESPRSTWSPTTPRQVAAPAVAGRHLLAARRMFAGLGGRRAALATRRPVVVCVPVAPPLGTPAMPTGCLLQLAHGSACAGQQAQQHDPSHSVTPAPPMAQIWRTPHPPERGNLVLCTRPMIHSGFLLTWQASGLGAQVGTQVGSPTSCFVSCSRAVDALSSPC